MVEARVKIRGALFLVLGIWIAAALIFAFRRQPTEVGDYATAKRFPPKTSPKVVTPQGVSAPQPTPAPKEAAPIAPPPIIDVIQENDFCAILKREGDFDAAIDGQGLALLDPDLAGNSVLEGALSSDAADAEVKLRQDSSPESRFRLAILVGGMTDGELRPKETRSDEAERLLLELEREDPTNGAYSLFLALAMEDLGRPRAEIDDAVARALQAPRFDVFHKSAAESIFSVGLESESKLFVASALVSKLWKPALWRGGLLVEELLKRYPDQASAEAVRDFAERLSLQDGRVEKGRESVAWDVSEVLLGHHLYEAAWKAEGRTDALPAAFQKNFSDYIFSPDMKALLDATSAYMKGEQAECPEDLIRAWYERERRDAASGG